MIPYNLTVCNVWSTLSGKVAYVKSVGCSAIHVEATKKIKLALLILPSKQKIYLPGFSLCSLSAIQNDDFRFITIGKYGSTLKKKYRTEVRGVAKNPVDHPNGGRTKSKNPQKSP